MSIGHQVWRRAAALALGAGVLAFSAAAQAHGGNKPEHGGVLKVVGDTTVELVNRPDHVEVWVEQEGEEIASSNYTGKLVVNAAARSEIALLAAGENKFEAKGAHLRKGSEVTVLLISKTNQARTAATFNIR
jgi:hypothetical protein